MVKIIQEPEVQENLHEMKDDNKGLQQSLYEMREERDQYHDAVRD